MDIFRFIGQTLFGWRWVVLIDFDGERNLRRIKGQSGRSRVSRHVHLGDDCLLLDGGKIKGVCYVHGWEPYIPFATPIYPEFSE